jgi:hypothetical protein
MIAVDEARAARRSGDVSRALALFRRAVELECSAIDALTEESTWFTERVLRESAFNLMLDADMLEEAIRMAGTVIGSPNATSAEVNYFAHLLRKADARWHAKAAREFMHVDGVQLVFVGPGVEDGALDDRVLMKTIDSFRRLMVRTVEMDLGQPFRDGGRPGKTSSNVVDFRLSPAVAACYAVSLLLPKLSSGDGERMLQVSLLPDDVPSSEDTASTAPKAPKDFVRTVMESLDLLERREFSTLQSRFSDERYFNHFLLHSAHLAPDGIEVQNLCIQLKADSSDAVDQVSLSDATRFHADSMLRPKAHETADLELRPEITEPESHRVVGELIQADAKGKHSIAIMDKDGQLTKIEVKAGLEDVVRMFFKHTVEVELAPIIGRKGRKAAYELVGLPQEVRLP